MQEKGKRTPGEEARSLPATPAAWANRQRPRAYCRRVGAASGCRLFLLPSRLAFRPHPTALALTRNQPVQPMAGVLEGIMDAGPLL